MKFIYFFITCTCQGSHLFFIYQGKINSLTFTNHAFECIVNPLSVKLPLKSAFTCQQQTFFISTTAVN